MSEYDLRRSISSLNTMVDSALGSEQADWKAVWAAIKEISGDFKQTRFAEQADRQTTWADFQSIVERVKEQQQEAAARRAEASARFARLAEGSSGHLAKIERLTEAAKPATDLENALFHASLGGLGMIVNAAIGAVLGPIDEARMELDRCSRVMKDAWAYYKEQRDNMLRNDREAAKELLSSAQEYLNNAWAEYKGHRQQAYEERQARREERAQKQEEWRSFMRDKLERRYNAKSIVESKLERAKSNRSANRDKLADAWSDSFRENVLGWIEQDDARIEQYESDLEDIESDIASIKEKLN